MRLRTLLAIALLGCGGSEPVVERRNENVPAVDMLGRGTVLVGEANESIDRAPLLGLLRLPEVFGSGPCDRAAMGVVTLHARAAGGDSIGTIAVATPWTHHPEGGCSGLEVVSRVGGAVRPLPTREIAYEEPAAIVVARSGDDWYRVRLDDATAAWVRVADASRFASIDVLITDGLAHLTEAWDGRLAGEPGAAPRTIATEAGAAARPVRVLATRLVDGRHWAHVEMLAASPCDGGDPRAVDAGWVPLHDAAGAPTVWFHARGC